MTQPVDPHGLEAPVVAGVDYPSWEADEIVPRLFMGGTHHRRTIADPARRTNLRGRGHDFDAVVTLYAWAQPVQWEVEELRYGFGDGSLDTADLRRVLRAADWAHDRWQAQDRVLIRCQAGLNRSGLVTALVLMKSGMAPDEAIALIRRQRSPHALCNLHFVRWLLREAPAQLGQAAPEPRPDDGGQTTTGRPRNRP